MSNSQRKSYNSTQYNTHFRGNSILNSVKDRLASFGNIFDMVKKKASRSKPSSNGRKTSYSRSSAVSGGKVGKKPSRKLLLATYFASFTLFAILGGLFLVLVVFAAYARALPNPNQLLDRDDELSTKIFDREGNTIFEVFGEKNRQLVKIANVSPHVVHATMATEDSNFYSHQGFDFLAYARAIKNTITGQGLQGGSTITQQVIKNTLLTQDRTVDRKIKEFILSLQLENRYSKDEILQMYLNETPYGGQNYGVLTAAKYYFNKHPKDLTIAESAYLAGLPQSPSRYSYFSSDPSLGLERKNYVLYLMNERGWLTSDGKRETLSDEDYQAALKEDLAFQQGAISFEAPHFVFYVKELLEDVLGKELVEQGGLQVTTTLDASLQEKAQEIVKEEVEAARGLNVGNGSLVAVDPNNGHILAMVGSKDYFADSEPEGCISGITGENSCTFEPALNVALANRQPGSSIKPLTYVTLLEQGYTAAYPFLDVPTTFIGKEETGGKPYAPVNYDGKYRGVMSLRRSLANSLNVTAVKALKIAGIDNMIETAESLGISTFKDRSRFGLSLTLGGGETKLVEMTGAFAAFAADGVYREPVAILEVKDARGNTLYKWRDSGGRQAISEESAYIIADILSDDGARSAVFGTNSLLNIPGHDVAVKTGTTDDKRDNYAIGFTPNIVVGVWVGNNNNDAMNPNVASGLTGATPIWRNFMISALDEVKKAEFEAPKGVKKIEVDTLTGMLPYRDFSRRSEWFADGTEPTAVSEWYQRLEICKADGLLANDACRDADETEEKTFIKITAELPEWQDDVDRWVNEHYKESVYFPPEVETALDFDDDGDVKKDVDPKIYILDYEEGDTVPRDFRLKVQVSSPNDIESVKIYLDDKEVTSDESEPYGYNFSFSESDAGEHEFRVKVRDDRGNDAEKVLRLRVS